MNRTQRKMALAALGCAMLCALGCTKTRTVYVPHGEAVRIRAPIEKAKVWVTDADGKEVPGEITIPEGWYSLPKE